MLCDILDDDHKQWHPPLIRHYINFWTSLIWISLLNFTQMCNISIKHTQRVRHANRWRLLRRTPGRVPIWDLHVLLSKRVKDAERPIKHARQDITFHHIYPLFPLFKGACTNIYRRFTTPPYFIHLSFPISTYYSGCISCIISCVQAFLSCKERQGNKKFKIKKNYLSSRIRTNALDHSAIYSDV